MKKTLLLMTMLSTSMFAESFSINSHVKVTRTEANFSDVTTQMPYDECHDVREETGGTSIGGGLVGGAIGGVLGHQVGGGSGKTAATIGGAVIGTMIGSNAGSTPRGYNIVRKCQTLYRQTTNRVQDGYTNYGILQGQTISVNSSERLSTIPVTITFSY